MRYKAYITDSNLIFWTKNSTDKPTKEYFYNLMNTIKWTELGNITPNFINQFNCSITVDKDSYTYLKLVDNQGITKYFCVDSIDKILKDGFVINLSLDVFTTYSYYLFDNIKDKPVFVNRTTSAGLYVKNNNAHLLQDDLISFSNAKMEILNDGGISSSYKLKNENCYYHLGEKHKTILFKMDAETINRVSGTEYPAMLDGINKTYGQKIYKCPVFDIFQDVNGDYYIFPIFSDGYSETSGVMETRLIFNGQVSYRFNINFSEGKVRAVKDNKFWISKYKGRYHIPYWDILISSSRWGVIECTTNSSFLMCAIIPQGIINIFENQNLNYSPKITYENYLDPQLPGIFTYYVSKIPQVGKDYPAIKINSNSGTNFTFSYFLFSTPINNVSFIFNETSGVEFFNNSTFGNLTISSPGTETLPVSTNSYIQYIAGVQSSQNTNMEIAKQQATFNSVKSGISGALGIIGGIGSLFTGNIAGGLMGLANSALNMGTGIASSVMQYQNQKRQLDASNADKLRTSTANNINTSNKTANYINSFATNNSYTYYTKLSFSSFTHPVILIHTSRDSANINKIIWDCGYLVNQQMVLNDLDFSLDFYDDYVNKFIYWDMVINTDYVKVIFKNSNNELIDAITTTINNPIRFWKVYPNYTERLYFQYN